METQQTPLIQAIVSQLQFLSQESLQEVLDFTEFLRWKTKATLQPNRGSAEALLSCAGTWLFENGEREKLEKEIREMRGIVKEGR
jgi:hypothetical protein